MDKYTGQMGGDIQAGMTDTFCEGDKSWRVWQTVNHEGGGWRGVLHIRYSKRIKNRKNNMQDVKKVRSYLRRWRSRTGGR